VKHLVALALLAAACRTEIAPIKKEAPHVVYVGDKECSVRDFPGASDLPDGSKNLGWVQVKKAGSDDDTFVKLREKICEMGGDALSQPAWVREADEYEPSILKANAWSLP
jgi:hypothetical protein